MLICLVFDNHHVEVGCISLAATAIASKKIPFYFTNSKISRLNGGQCSTTKCCGHASEIIIETSQAVQHAEFSSSRKVLFTK